MMNFRTDLALERRDLYRRANNIANEVDGLETQEEVIGEINKSEKVDEKKEIEENRDERKRRLRDFSRELVNRSKWKTKF